jgi:uncharacterized peroxidase-related enzyme
MTTPEYEILSRISRPTPKAVRTNIPVIEESEASGETAEAYEYFRSRFGRPDVPGILKCFSSSPALLKQIMEMSSTLVFADGYLGRRVKEMIATYVSSLNECPYCADSHGFFLKVHGGSDVVLNALAAGDTENTCISASEQHLLGFVHKVTCESYKISETDVKELRSAGWDDRQIAECVHVSAMFACFNRVANAFGLPSQGLLNLTADTKQQEEKK